MLLHSDFFKPRESGKRSSEAVTSVTLPLKRILLDDSNVSRKTPSHDGQGIDDMSAVDGNVTKSTVENNFQKDTPLPFGILCKTFDLIEGTTKRLEINDHLIDLFLPLIESKSFDLATVVHLCLSRLGPVYRSPELGLGETLLMKAIASCTGSTAARIKSRVEEVGDVGLVAEQSRSTQKVLFQPRPITCASLFKILGEIAAIIGQSSSGKKIDKVSSLYVACRGNEAKYLFRLLEGKLRIGLAEQSILAALAQASLRLFPLPSSSSKYSKYNTSLDGETNADVCRQQAVIILKSVYNCLPDYNILLPALMEFGIWELPNHCHMTPGVPLKPMLAYPTRSIGEVLDRFEGLPFTCEFKYDGERGQIHKLENGKIMIYSRNSEDMTAKYPEVLSRISTIEMGEKGAKSSYILDCEMVAFNKIENKILPFQVLSTRKRKDVTEESVEVHVCVFAFDLLYLNGEPLVEQSFRSRRTLLTEHFMSVPGEFQFAQHADPSSTEEIQSLLDEAIASSCEGLMVKTLDQESSYEPSKRSRKWLKVKKDYLEGCGDSLDLVVIGGYIGRGKRTGVYGGFLLACFDPDCDEYQAICKIGTGFSETDLESHAESLKLHQISTPKTYYRFTEGIKPDVWFAPVQVWEVKAADFSISPVYTAGWGLVDEGKGISLRFPRFLRVREDKTPEMASNSQMIADLYNAQSLSKPSLIEEEDY